MTHAKNISGSKLQSRSVQKDLIRKELGKNWSPELWTSDQVCLYALIPAGKLFRPLLLLDVIEALGADSRDFISAAAGIEFAHVGGLIHDDIIDGDGVRRWRGSVHAKYGITAAISAGDGLIFKIFTALLQCRGVHISDSLILDAVGVLAEAGIDTCRGEAAEENLAGDIAITVDEYLSMIELKTAALFRATCQVGAILSGAEQSHIEHLREYGRCLGIAFQIQDDVLPYLVETSSGKPSSSDIKNKRVTIPILCAYANARPEDKRKLKELLEQKNMSPAAVHELLTPLLIRTQGLEQATQLGRWYAQTAGEQLKGLDIAHREILLNYTSLAVNRSL